MERKDARITGDRRLADSVKSLRPRSVHRGVRYVHPAVRNYVPFALLELGAPDTVTWALPQLFGKRWDRISDLHGDGSESPWQ